jgi:FKBP-type peptidyl-prolyl cis-trans isomerase FkpA
LQARDREPGKQKMSLATHRTPVLTAALLAGLTLGVNGCRDANRVGAFDDEEAALVDDRPEATTEVEASYAPALNIDLDRMQRAESGFYYEDLEVGTGEVAEIGRHVEVHYTSWLPDGTRIMSSRDGELPEDFVLGTGAVIIGWEEGMIGMRQGGRRKIVIPPALAYGRDGYGEVPPYATLVIDVELIAVH